MRSVYPVRGERRNPEVAASDTLQATSALGRRRQRAKDKFVSNGVLYPAAHARHCRVGTPGKTTMSPSNICQVRVSVGTRNPSATYI
jgi:hypothetical protein